MYKMDRKNLRSRVVCRGGVTFHNSILQSLRVNNFVPSRALKNKFSEVPIRCYAGDGCNFVHMKGASNLQQTLEKCVTRSDPKDCRRLGMSRAQLSADTSEYQRGFSAFHSLTRKSSCSPRFGHTRVKMPPGSSSLS